VRKDRQIKKFLDNRKFVLDSLKRLKKMKNLKIDKELTTNGKG